MTAIRDDTISHTPHSIPCLNIISSGYDAYITGVRATLADENLAFSQGDVTSIIQKLVQDEESGQTEPKPIVHLDLIGPSADPDCYLMIGDWTIDIYNVNNFAQSPTLELLLRYLKFKDMRLLGCSTATTDNGWHVIQRLAESLNIEVFGTKDLICADDFTHLGFRSSDKLYSSRHQERVLHGFTINSLPTAKVSKPLILDLLHSERPQRMRPVPWTRRILSHEVAKELSTLIDPSVAWSLPKLLARPLVEVMMPLERDEFLPVQVLVKYEIVRVFPSKPSDQSDLVYRVTDPAALKALLLSLGLHIGSLARRSGAKLLER